MAVVPSAFDCAMRQLALEFAVQIQPLATLRQLRDLADALNGSPEALCRNATPTKPWHASDKVSKPQSQSAIIVSPTGDDAAAGTLASPLHSVRAAIARARLLGIKEVALRAGTYRESSAIELGPGDSGLTLTSYDNEPAVISGAILLQPSWTRVHTTAAANIWTTDVPSGVRIDALRVGGERATRSRYPNADPARELNPSGWITARTQWLPPVLTHLTNPPIEYAVTDPRWLRNDTKGPRGYAAGIGGSCAHLEPPYGYWCSARSARDSSGQQTHRSPSGVNFAGLLPNAPYSNAAGAVVHACNLANCWFNWAFEVDRQSVANQTLQWSVGGFQGAEGFDTAGNWYIENVFEELDAPGEFYFNATARRLFYFHNASVGTPPPTTLTFEAVGAQVLLNVTGTRAEPARDVTVRNIQFRDTAATILEPHGMPSGGDWTLHRGGAITLQGTERLTVTSCSITQTDGNGISINGYNRNLSVEACELSWIGESGITSWGFTSRGMGGGNVSLPPGVGMDGTGGEQPRGTRIVGNIVREVGIFQKQASAFFQVIR